MGYKGGKKGDVGDDHDRDNDMFTYDIVSKNICAPANIKGYAMTKLHKVWHNVHGAKVNVRGLCLQRCL